MERKMGWVPWFRFTASDWLAYPAFRLAGLPALRLAIIILLYTLSWCILHTLCHDAFFTSVYNVITHFLSLTASILSLTVSILCPFHSITLAFYFLARDARSISFPRQRRTIRRSICQSFSQHFPLHSITFLIPCKRRSIGLQRLLYNGCSRTDDCSGTVALGQYNEVDDGVYGGVHSGVHRGVRVGAHGGVHGRVHRQTWRRHVDSTVNYMVDSPVDYTVVQSPLSFHQPPLLTLKVRHCRIDLLFKSLSIPLPETHNWIDLLPKRGKMKQAYTLGRDARSDKTIVSLPPISLPFHSITNFSFYWP